MNEEKPVIRDPRTGYLDRHSAYEGWAPTDRFIDRPLGRLIYQAIFVLVVLGPLVIALLSIKV